MYIISPGIAKHLMRIESDITGWIDYFVEGMVFAFEKVVNQMVLISINAVFDNNEIIQNKTTMSLKSRNMTF